MIAIIAIKYPEQNRDKTRMVGEYPFPELPFDIAEMTEKGVIVPGDIAGTTGYMEFLEMLETYALSGLKELRAVNPITRGRPVDTIERDD